MLFSSVIGQNAVKKLLIQSVQSGRIPHAQLFLGSPGTGGLAMAMAFAQYVHCENKTAEDSCGKCAGCIKSQQLIHPDTHYTFPFIANPDVKKKSDEKPICSDWAAAWRKALAETPYMNVFQWMQQLSAENKQANINAAECNEIIKKSSFKSFESAYKVFVIWMPEYLDKEGNKLLKLLEEPPENTLFLLVAEDEKNILATILSRTQLVKFTPIEESTIERALIEFKQTDPALAAQVAIIANGNYNAALELIENDDFESEQLWLEWVDLLVNQKRALWLDFTEQFQRLGREKQKHFIATGLAFIRQVLVFQQLQIPSALWKEKELNLSRNLAEKMSVKQLEKWVSLLNKLLFYIERNGNAKILCLNACIYSARIIHSTSGTLAL